MQYAPTRDNKKREANNKKIGYPAKLAGIPDDPFRYLAKFPGLGEGPFRGREDWPASQMP